MNKKIIISILVQLLLIPIFYFVLYRFALLFHEPYIPTSGDGMDFYKITIIFLTLFVLITLPILNLIQSFLVKNEIVSASIHFIWFVCIIWFTKGDLLYRPYDFGLIIFCVGFTIFTRLIINKILEQIIAKTHTNNLKLHEI